MPILPSQSPLWSDCIQSTLPLWALPSGALRNVTEDGLTLPNSVQALQPLSQQQPQANADDERWQHALGFSSAGSGVQKCSSSKGHSKPPAAFNPWPKSLSQSHKGPLATEGLQAHDDMALPIQVPPVVVMIAHIEQSPPTPPQQQSIAASSGPSADAAARAGAHAQTAAHQTPQQETGETNDQPQHNADPAMTADAAAGADVHAEPASRQPQLSEESARKQGIRAHFQLLVQNAAQQQASPAGDASQYSTESASNLSSSGDTLPVKANLAPHNLTAERTKIRGRPKHGKHEKRGNKVIYTALTLKSASDSYQDTHDF